MNITDNLTRIKEGKGAIITALQNKGSDIKNDTLINEISTYVDKLEIGGGGSDTPSQPEIPELTAKYLGASVFRIEVPTDNYEFAINLCNDATKATYDVDWGDGSLESGLTTDEQHHIYTKKGIYDVNIYNLSKEITLGGSYSVNGEYSNISNWLISQDYLPYLFNNSNNTIYTGFIQTINNCICTDVLIGNNIPNIGYRCFNGYSSLRNITIGNSVTSISDYAFQGCSSLQNINIPNSVTSIKTYAFSDCISLQSITIPESVTKIDNYTFYECSSLQNITIPNSIKSIGNSAFSGCSSLLSVDIPSSITSMDSSVFYGCRNLQNITIPESVTKINSSTFYQCCILQSITIPESVTKIDNSVFSGCFSLQSITFLNPTPPTITTSSFPTNKDTYYYPQRYLYVPKESIGYNEGNWKTYLIDKGWELRYIEDKDNTTQESILKFKTTNNVKIKIPYICESKLISEDFVDGEYIYTYDKEITQLSGLLFCQEMLVDITIPNTVKKLGRSTFWNSPYLKNKNKIIVPEGIEYIDRLCYNNKDNCILKELVLPSTIKEIQEYNFYFPTYNERNVITCKAMTAPIITTNTFTKAQSYGSIQIVLRVPEGAIGYEEGSWVRDYITVQYVPLSEL